MEAVLVCNNLYGLVYDILGDPAEAEVLQAFLHESDIHVGQRTRLEPALVSYRTHQDGCTKHLVVGEKEITPEQVFSILEDRSPAADAELPDTGVGLELERVLSAPFIRTQDYGTRSSTVVLIECTGDLTFVERSFDPTDESQIETCYKFRIGSKVY